MTSARKWSPVPVKSSTEAVDPGRAPSIRSLSCSAVGIAIKTIAAPDAARLEYTWSLSPTLQKRKRKGARQRVWMLKEMELPTPVVREKEVRGFPFHAGAARGWAARGGQ